jgi:hypothetical protein
MSFSYTPDRMRRSGDQISHQIPNLSFKDFAMSIKVSLIGL